MLTIKKILDKDAQKTICEACSICYDPEQFAYSGYENEKLVACSQFRIENNYPSDNGTEKKVHPSEPVFEAFLEDTAACITSLRNADGVTDTEALVIMGKAVIYYLYYQCGIKNIYFTQQQSENSHLAQIVGFHATTDGKWFCDAEKLFNTPCNGRCITLDNI